MDHLAKNRHPRTSWKSLVMSQRSLLIGLCVIALTMGTVGSALGITFNFTSVNVSPSPPGTSAALKFVGSDDTFSFISPDSHDFQIGSSTGTGAAVGLVGDITGTYVITGIMGTSFQTGTVTATGSGSHQVIIYDGAGKNFTAKCGLG